MDVLEELTEFEDQIDRAHIERRIDDWVRRIENLYSDVRSWLPEGWAASGRYDVVMHEDLMRNFGITARRLPSLLLDNKSISFRLEPRGLWIIGANGRLDLFSSQGHYVIVDRAEFYADPQWMISKLTDQLNQDPFTRQILMAILT